MDTEWPSGNTSSSSLEASTTPVSPVRRFHRSTFCVTKSNFGKARYHNDLWIFDTQEYVWRQVEFREGDSKPSPRSGFSFLPTPEGVVLHGGYCKEYKKGQRPVGVMLEDTWILKYLASTFGLLPPPISTTDISFPSLQADPHRDAFRGYPFKVEKPCHRFLHPAQWREEEGQAEHNREERRIGWTASHYS